jgi:hypothetical protein
MGGTKSTSRAVEKCKDGQAMAKTKQTDEANEGQLLREIKKLTSRQFVYEDGWCGMVPFDGKLSEMQTGPPVPFAELTWREQADVLRSFIQWDGYPERDWNDEYSIRENIADGKQPEQWLESTSLRESFRLLAEGKTPPPPKQYPELSEQDLRAALGMAEPHMSGPKVEESNVPEPASAGAKAFQDILRNDLPRETETKTQDRGGQEI